MARRDECSDTSKTGDDRKSRESYMYDTENRPSTVLEEAERQKAQGSHVRETRGMSDTKAFGDR